MHPVIFSFGNLTLYAYGLFIALGFIAAMYYLSYQIKISKEKIITQDELYSLLVYIIVAAIAGARLLYVLINFKMFTAAPLDIFKVWHGGLVYYGGFITAVIFSLFYVKAKKMPLAKLADLFAPAIALGHFFGRLGCFLAGCCYGKACALPWAVAFNDPASLAPQGVYLHPTQLYEAAANLIFFVFLHLYNKKQHAGYAGYAGGKTFALYLAGYAVLRFAIEFLRGDYRGGQFLGLSVSQCVSVFILFAGVFIFYKINKTAVKNEK